MPAARHRLKYLDLEPIGQTTAELQHAYCYPAVLTDGLGNMSDAIVFGFKADFVNTDIKRIELLEANRAQGRYEGAGRRSEITAGAGFNVVTFVLQVSQ